MAVSPRKKNSSASTTASSSAVKPNDYKIFGVQLLTKSVKGRKKYLVSEDGKKIWRDERLITGRSKRAYWEEMKRKAVEWVNTMKQSDIPDDITSLPDSEGEEETEAEDLKCLLQP